jgi:uncharacterized protein YcfL
MFRPSDQRRVQAAFDAAIEAPYEVTITLEDNRMTMRAQVMDPDNAAIPVVQAIWWYDPAGLKNRPQPSNDEVARIAAEFNTACQAYTAAQGGG